jgi:hypothetical protein
MAFKHMRAERNRDFGGGRVWNKIMPRASRGRPLGAENKDKPFREALRMEEKELAAGNVIDHPQGSLRWNAQQLLMRGDTPSVTQIADRLDGKPAQESSVHLDSARNNQSEAELREYLVAALIAANKDKEDEAPKQLNGNNGTDGLSSAN